ncbi:MAG: malto-oligosyltrehalose synthase [bacterium]
MKTSKKQQDNTKIPISTYRLQFNKHFTFKDAQKIIPYLRDIGISHCYSSPILWAKTGSLHGYDIIDHSKLNPEIGSSKDFDELVKIIQKNKMGIILDIVPNHMGICRKNKWWVDVLENGQASQYANFFDIDWKPIKKELYGKILVPVLHDHYGNILAGGEFKINFDRDNGKLKLIYFDHEFPINPSSYTIIMEHRIDKLESTLGSAHNDFLEYQSIMTVFKNLPKINETDFEKIKERNREKEIAYKRFSELCKRKNFIANFIEENLLDFRCSPDDVTACQRVHEVLENQAYRLAYWRVSSDIINYRRFFDINALIGLRAENNDVFNETHSVILDLIEQKKIQGLRIDHPDGLLDPLGYFITLQKEAGKRLGIDFDSSNEKHLSSELLPFYVVAEKIIAPFEKLPQNWAIHGTIGYEFLNNVNNLFLDNKNLKKISRTYHKFINKEIDFNELVIKCKKTIMRTALTSELSTLSNHLSLLSEKYYSARDYTLNSLREALTEIIACFPVYRTYISQEEKNNKDIDYIKWAVRMAKKRSMSTDPSIYDFIEKILLCEFESNKESDIYGEILNFTMKFQQYTGPLMAKGLEDTSFYNYNRLISLNEVGGNPATFGISVNDFHNGNMYRLNATPHGLLATSTHDTKLSEDVRARISSISEIPEVWRKKINKWSRINKSKKTRIDNLFIPDKNDEYLFYQILTGLWTDEDFNNEKIKKIIERIKNYMLKAVREAKTHTSWININTQYENALSEFIRRVLSSSESHPFWKEFLPFQKEIALGGYNNSISQITLKFTSPGVPDIYQGNELWKYNLVDPDNRNPVDFNKFQKLFKKIKPFLRNSNEDFSFLFPLESGKLKLFISSVLLNFRQTHSNLFKKGNYIPLEVRGAKSENIIAFARSFENETIITVVPRLVFHMISEEKPFAIGEEVWKDTRIILPVNYRNFKDIFTGKTFYDFNSESADSENKQNSEICLSETSFNSVKQELIGSIINILPISVLYSDSSSINLSPYYKKF